MASAIVPLIVELTRRRPCTVQDPTPVLRLCLLQWGHGISAVEFVLDVVVGLGEVLLQWGHGISAVELPSTLLSHSSASSASMGPRHFSRGIATSQSKGE